MKIAICIPVYADTKAFFTRSLARMILYSTRVRPDIELDVFVRSGSILISNRMNLLADAKDWSAEHILWLDADHVFPPHTLERLLAHDLDMVGCNYAVRGVPTGPSATAMDGQPLWTTAEKASAGEVEEVLGLGLGLCLIRMSAIAAMTPPIFNAGLTAEGVLIAEDGHFFNHARETGFRVWCDHALSNEIGHLHEVPLSNADTVNHRELWQQKWDNRRKTYF